jgi:amino acid adenylation domain-containing protein
MQEWNRTETSYPRDRTIAQLFEEQVARSPEAVAVISGNRRMTYRELNCYSNQLARHLQTLGVQEETLVGIAIERSPEMVAAMLAILKAGGAYVPLDPKYPRERTSLLIEDAAMPVILATESTRRRMANGKARLVSLDGEADGIASQSVEPVICPATAENMAYVIYTSGSTGKPKGVMVEHRNVVNFFAGMDRVIGAEPGVWLAVTSISFDISILELLWTLTHGFQVVIHGDEGTHTIAAEIVRYGITHLQSTPTLASMIVMDSNSLPALAKLKKVFLGGEALPPSLVRQIRQVFRGEMFNMYGPTETTIWSTTCRIPAEVSAGVSIGKPIANTQVYVLDSQMQEVPVGEAGDLFIGGDGVVRGYWRREELTAERFLPDPFLAGNRIYKTGDVARWRPDGNLDFLGRSDFQVKLRGFRIELGEIETALEQQFGVRQAVVVAREDKPGDKRLIAYLVGRAGETTSVPSLRRALESKLPDYMVPSVFVFLECLPLTPNGKIDRNALPAPPTQVDTAQISFEPPRSDLESTIAQTWGQELGIEQVGLNDNFFDLGAHSLMVAEVHVQLQQILNRDISLVDLFQFPTVRSLASHLSGERTPAPRVSDRAKRRLAARKVNA